MSIVGQNIKRFRRERDISQKALAEQAGTSQALIGGLETEAIESTKKLPQIAKALGVRPEDIDPDYGLHGTSTSFHGSAHAPLVPSWIYNADEVPIYSTTGQPNGSLRRNTRPIGKTDRIGKQKFSVDAYALVVSADVMVPEIHPGDTLYVNPDLPPIDHTACLFYKDCGLDEVSIARLVRVTDADWHSIVWNLKGKKQAITLSRDEWPVCHRIVAKDFRE